MELENASGFPAAWTVGLRPDGRELLVVVIKATYRLPSRSGDEPVLSPEPAPLVTADEFTGEPGLSSTTYEADFAPIKPRCDVLLNGSAYAPGGRPVERLRAALCVGAMSKELDVVGYRRWVRSLGVTSATPIVPFTRVPVSYDVAFGGRDVSSDNPSKHEWYALNHVGIGFHVNHSAEAIDKKPLPHTEEPGNPIKKPNGKYRPMAFGAVGRAWSPRAEWAGTYDQRWLDEVFPFLPANFNEAYYQAAPADQQTAYLQGNEWVELTHLTPEGHLRFRLPPLDMPVTFYPKSGPKESMQAAADTLLLEPDLGRFTITWRASRPLRRNAFEVRETVVGKPSRAWTRARETGKTYYGSLASVPLRGEVE